MFKKFFMDTTKYEKEVRFYAEKFQLKEKWTISVVDSFPQGLKMNYSAEKAIACTNWGSKTVLFKSKLMTMPTFLARAYIRHELRHCAQIEKIFSKMKEKYGDNNLADIHTSIIIINDNQNGYGKSIMGADAWLASFNVFLDINKVVDKIVKKTFVWWFD